MRESDAVVAIVDDDLSVREGVSSLTRSAGGNKTPEPDSGSTVVMGTGTSLILRILGLRC
jgi:FixJ family two-component response regulator